MEATKEAPRVIYEFPGFRLDPEQRLLLRNGEPVVLWPKVFDTLVFLVRNSSRILEKDELMKALWPKSFVEEGNLSQNIFILRKALGDDQNGNRFIQTIPRRGYQFVAAVKALEASTAAEQSSSLAHYWRNHSPFRGLQAFEPEDAWLFFGRQLETEELLGRLRRSSALIIIGNSGCGKSSLVRAGLIPTLREGHVESWRVAVVRPSAAPFDYLAEALPHQLMPELPAKERLEFIAECRNKLSQGGQAIRNAISALVNDVPPEPAQNHILLVVDQFEELFTLTADRNTREAYINTLLAASGGNGSLALHLVLVLRADFYSDCLEHPGLARLLDRNPYNVPRVEHNNLRTGMEKRLALAGAHAESGLTDSLLEDVGDEPGNLALLEHALGQLWEKCGGFGCSLTNAAYSSMGRLRGALSAHADEVYHGITDPTQKALAQKIFLELVHLGQGAPDTRRRVRKAELLSLGAAELVEALLERLTASRLISVSVENQETFAEVSHEALIREWSTLGEWLTQNREELRLRRRLDQAAQEWQGLGRDRGALLQGARLAQGKEWLLRHPAAPALVREFIKASSSAQVESEQVELRKQKTAAARLRWFSALLACLLLVALAAVCFARRQQVLAESRALAAQSEEMLTRDQGRALDLAVRAWNIARVPESYRALTAALPQALSTLTHDGEIVVATFSPDGERVLTASWDHTARVWSAIDGRLLTTLQGHKGQVGFAAFSPDGQRIVTASADHTARIWNTADGHLLFTLKGHTDTVHRAEFSPDGQRIVTASSDHTARVWSAIDGHLLTILSGHTDGIWAATFSQDNQLAATASLDHTVRLWRVADGRCLAILQGHKEYVLRAEFSPDGKRVLTASNDGTARVWNTSNGRLLLTLQHNGLVDRATFSLDGTRILTASHDETAKLWSSDDGHLIYTLQHQGVVHHAEFSRDGTLIVTASYDGTAQVWNAGDGRLLTTLQGHAAAVMHASFSPDGQRIVTSSNDHTARIWTIAGGRLLTLLQGQGPFFSGTFSPDGQSIAAASSDHTGRLWNATDGRLLATLPHSDAVWVTAFSPQGQYLVTTSFDHTSRVWNTKNGRLLVTLQGHTDNVWDAAFSPDTRHIVTASWDHTARLWSTVDGHPLATLEGHTDKVVSTQFSPDGLRVVTASWDHTARVWNAADGHLLATLQGHAGRVVSAVFSPDGQHILTASSDHTARLWDATDGHLLVTLQGHTDRLNQAIFSSDGRLVLTASADHTARLWGATDGRLLTTLQGHAGSVWSGAFSLDNRRVVTASADHTARVWDASTGRLLVILEGHNDGVYTARFSPDGACIVTSSFDQTARVWQILTLDDVAKMLKQQP